jgi:hypothetical protein
MIFQVLKQLPKKVDVIHRCTMAFEQREGYDACIAQFKKWKAFKEAHPEQATNDYSGATILMKLRKWAQHSLLQRVHYTDDKLQVMSRLMLSVSINEEPAMKNLIIDGAAGGETKRRHDVTFPLLTLHRGKDVYIFLQDFSKKNTKNR